MLPPCVCVCVCACVRACVCTCVRVLGVANTFVDKLHFPNGIELSQDGQSILVVETTKARVIRLVGCPLLSIFYTKRKSLVYGWVGQGEFRFEKILIFETARDSCRQVNLFFVRGGGGGGRRS